MGGNYYTVFVQCVCTDAYSDERVAILCVLSDGKFIAHPASILNLQSVNLERCTMLIVFIVLIWVR